MPDGTAAVRAVLAANPDTDIISQTSLKLLTTTLEIMWKNVPAGQTFITVHLQMYEAVENILTIYIYILIGFFLNKFHQDQQYCEYHYNLK